MSSSCILNTQLFVVHCFFSFILGGGGVIGFLFQRFTSRKRGRELRREDQMPVQCEVNFEFVYRSFLIHFIGKVNIPTCTYVVAKTATHP